jgi:hypothetical protein
MKKSETLIHVLCAPHCPYYKQDRNEEMQCRGALVTERLLKRGVFSPGREKALTDPDRNALDATIRALCAACDFREDGCDFALDNNAPPCGGFAVLARLLGAGVCTEEDIK